MATAPHAPQDHVRVIEVGPRRNGIAGQLSIRATVLYRFRYAPAQTVVTTFVGSVYGGPVVMISDDGTETIVTNPSRFGDFGRTWVERFYCEPS